MTPARASPTKGERLFYSFLLCTNAGSVGELDAWARKVKLQQSSAEELRASWTPPESEWPLWQRSSTLFHPMESAFTCVRDFHRLNIIAAAMRLWDGPGRIDELNGTRLQNYFKRERRAPSKSVKKPGPLRHKSWSIVHVAAFVLKHGVALRKALTLDGMEPDEVPTAYERATAAEARLTELESELSELAELFKKAKDAKRKADAYKAEAKEKAKAKARQG